MNQAAKTPTGHGYSSSQTISSFDSELWDAMTLETQRQEEHIELIASENYKVRVSLRRERPYEQIRGGLSG